MDLIELKIGDSNINNQRHPWEIARLKIIESKLLKTLKNKKENYTFLDIGSGDTYVVENLAKTFSNTNFLCVDSAFTDNHINTFEAKYSNTNIKVFKNQEDASKFIDTEITIILLLDVLEHIKDDEVFLKKLNSLNHFTKNSLLFITVPAFQSLFTRHDVILGHFRRYTNKNLEALIMKTGFKTIKKGYFFFSLLFPRAIAKVVEKLKLSNQKSTQVSTWSQKKLITNLFVRILLTDYRISTFLKKINIPTIGLSNFILCKKNAS